MMKLTVNNIAYINEIHSKGGNITVWVMMKNHCISDARLYECKHDLIGIPATVLKFMDTHKKVLVLTDEKLQQTRYTYK
jgi:hypothetical protein